MILPKNHFFTLNDFTKQLYVSIRHINSNITLVPIDYIDFLVISRFEKYREDRRSKQQTP